MSKELLKKCYLFKDMTESELTKLESALTSETYDTDEDVFKQGDEAHSMHLIKKGLVKVLQVGNDHDMIAVATLSSGSHFGEMAFLDNEKRSATVTAAEKTELLRVDYEELRKVLTADTAMSIKFLNAMALFLCGRLRITTNDLSFARERNVKHF